MTRACIRLLLASVLLLGVRLESSQGGADAVALHVRYSAADQELRRYAYVPFRVPPGTTHISLSYRYDRAGGDNAVDLGVYEPGSVDRQSPALRGWTGGARSDIEIATDMATPGYWAGPIPAGEWHVMFGLYKVAASGVDIDLTVTTSSEPRQTTNALPDRPPALAGRGPAWYSGVLHTHTQHSDGQLATSELITKAVQEHLDFLAITDHNNTVHQRDLSNRDAALVISGDEVTTTVGHFNVWGLSGPRAYIDFRVGAEGTVADLIAAARLAGGAVSINHPVSNCAACSWTASIPAGVDAIEIANGTPEERRQSMLLWDSLLRQGRRVTAVEGRDWHGGMSALAAPAVRVRASDLSEAAILESIRAGRVVVLADASLPAPQFEARAHGTAASIGDTLIVQAGTAVNVDVSFDPHRAGAHLDVLWNGEVVSSSAPGVTRLAVRRHPVDSGYFRAHVVTQDGGFLAVTNPIYVEVH